METVIMLALAAAGAAAAFLVGYGIGRDRGYMKGISVAASNLKDVYEISRKGKEEIQNETKEVVQSIKAEREGSKQWKK